MEQFKVLILGSGHHVHLKQEDFAQLFGPEAVLEEKRQLGEDPRGGFLSKQHVTVVGPKGQFQAAILGPLRPYTQIEVSYTDARLLGVVPIMSNSGALEGTSPCTLVGPEGELTLPEGLMVVRRHVHLDPNVAQALGCGMSDLLRVRVSGPRALVFEQVSIAPGFAGNQSVMHIDYDELNAAGLLSDSPVFGEMTFCRDEAEEAVPC